MKLAPLVLACTPLLAVAQEMPAKAPSSRALLADLESRDAQVRLRACEAAKQAAVKEARVLRALLEAQPDPALPIEHRAVDALVAAGHAAVPTLIAALDDRLVRIRACDALGAIRPIESRTIKALVGVIKQPRGDLGGSSAAVCALGRMGPEAREAVPALLALAKDASLRKLFVTDGSPLTYLNSIESLGRIGPDAHAAIPTLIELTHTAPGTNAATVRGGAVEALGRIGLGPARAATASGKAAAATDVLAAIRERLKDDSKDVVQRAGAALAMLDPNHEAPVRARVNGLHHLDAVIRAQTCKVLAAMGPAAGDAVEQLRRMASEDADADVRKAAEAAVAAIAAGR